MPPPLSTLKTPNPIDLEPQIPAPTDCTQLAAYKPPEPMLGSAAISFLNTTLEAGLKLGVTGVSLMSVHTVGFLLCYE